MDYERRLFILETLARKFKTDKIDSHDYIKYYAKYLPEKCDSLLEIGILKGAGLRMFDQFYNYKTDIHALDLFMEEGNMTVRECRELSFVPHKGSQSDIEFLSTIKDQFNVVSEDGSHNAYDQLVTFKHIFINNLTPNGLYVCEDLHTDKEPFYWNSEIENFEDTFLFILQQQQKNGRLSISKWFNEGEAAVFNNLISKIELHDDNIAFIWKK
jgi:hypothetical protein